MQLGMDTTTTEDKQPNTEVTDLMDVTVILNNVTRNMESGTEMKHPEAPVTVLLESIPNTVNDVTHEVTELLHSEKHNTDHRSP